MQKETAIDLLLDLLKRGKSAEMTASGYSMFPTLRPGDKVLVSPISDKISPVPGDILIVKTEDMLVLHRLIEILKDSEGKKVFITRGDSMNESDPPVRSDQLAGIAHSFRRNNKQKFLRRRIQTKTGYRVNRVKLWFCMKLKKMRSEE